MFVLSATSDDQTWVIAASTDRVALEQKAADTENDLNHVEIPDPEAVASAFEETRTGTWTWQVDLAEYTINDVPVV